MSRNRIMTYPLAVTPETEGVVAFPGRSARRSLLNGDNSLAVKSSVLASGGGEPAEFSVLVDGVRDPVDSGIAADCLVERIDADDLEELVARILVDPVGVENTERPDLAVDASLGEGPERAGGLQVIDSVGLGLSVGDTLGNSSLASSSSYADTVDNVSLLGLVSELARLLWARGSSNTVNGGKLTVFPSADTQEEAHQIRLLLFPNLIKVTIGTWMIFFQIQGRKKMKTHVRLRCYYCGFFFMHI